MVGDAVPAGPTGTSCVSGEASPSCPASTPRRARSDDMERMAITLRTAERKRSVGVRKMGCGVMNGALGDVGGEV